MTLLESIVAFVVLALVGIACLDLSRGAARLQQSSADWTQAISTAESAMSLASQGMPLDAPGESDERNDAGGSGRPSQPRVSVTRRLWRDGVDVLEVTVSLDGGGSAQFSRLVPRRSLSSGGAVAALPSVVR